MDMNPNTLEFASKRIARYSPETYEQNILESINKTIEPFDSVGINYLFHCVPGAITEKAVAFDHLKVLMNPGCRIFGSTILQGSVPRSWFAKRLMAFYNKKGIFSMQMMTLMVWKRRCRNASITSIWKLSAALHYLVGSSGSAGVLSSKLS